MSRGQKPLFGDGNDSRLGDGSLDYAVSSDMVSPEERHRQILLRKKEIEERTLDSSNRSLALLYESEKVGEETGKELHRQKEQLLRTEERLEDINSTLTQSERHLNGIKSVFGGLKNYLFAKSNSLPHPPTNQPPAIQTKLPANPPMKQEQSRRIDLREEDHPALRSKGLVQVKEDSSPDAILDRNLDEMAMGLSRLKGLALDLNSELEEHDDILTRLDDKASRAGCKVDKQNKDMSKLLKK